MMSKTYDVQVEQNGRLNLDALMLRPGETFELFQRDGKIVVEVYSQGEDHELQDWIRQMIETNVSFVTCLPTKERAYNMQELCEFIQRRLLAHDPLYPCVEIPHPDYDDCA